MQRVHNLIVLFKCGEGPFLLFQLFPFEGRGSIGLRNEVMFVDWVVRGI